MTSNRLPQPGVPASRLQAAKRWLLRSLPGRVLLAGVAIRVLALAAGAVSPASWAVLDVFDAIGSLAVLFAGGYLLVRGIVWAKRELLWRVRRKLILSYVFVGLVPSLLIVAFFLIAGALLFFNVSSFLVQSRVKTLVDQADYMAQSAALETEHGDPTPVLRARLEQRLRIASERYPFASMTVVPASGIQCPKASAQTPVAVDPLQLGAWQHLPAPTRLPKWIGCQGFAGLVAYALADASDEHRLFVRAVAFPNSRAPQSAVIVDLPFSAAVATRLQEETGIRLGAVSASESIGARGLPRGQALETADAASFAEGSEWVITLDTVLWDSGVTDYVTAAVELNLRSIYNSIGALSSRRDLADVLLGLLAFIGVLFLIIQFVALILGFALARQITGAVHDLFVGTEHLRNRDLTHQIPVHARDQLGELAVSFNSMTGEMTQLLKENAEKARMEQEMLAAREIQRQLLPSGPMTLPGVAVTAFCEPAREVAGDYFDFLPISEHQVGILIADVSGKGLPAGLYMAQLKVLVQSLARSHRSPRDFLKAVNRVVADNIDAKSFITMSYGVIDLSSRTMAYARAGHCPLIRVPGAAPAGLRKAEMLSPDGLVLGLKIDDGTMFDAMIQEVTVPLAADDLVVFFTDGISETMNAAFDCYGEHRLAHLLEQYAHLPFEQLRSFIFADLRAFAGDTDQHDDMTMVLLKVDGTRLPALAS